MIRTVIDTGVVVSAALRDRTPEEVVLFIVEHDEFEWITSSAILEEYTQVLARDRFGLPPNVLQQWRDVFDQFTTTIELEMEIDLPRDQKDAKFLACALAAEADFLITGDKDFEDARKLIETTIISVSQFKKLVMEKWS